MDMRIAMIVRNNRRADGAASGEAPAADPRTRRQSTSALALLALGVVYGDIGTSPLYAAKQTFDPEHGIALTPENIVSAYRQSSGR